MSAPDRATLRRWLENSPEPKPGPEGLVGWQVTVTDGIALVCSACMSRLIGRGCRVVGTAVYDDQVTDQPIGPCIGCANG